MSHRKQWGHSPSHQTKRELISHRIVCCLNVNWTEGDCYLGLLTRRVAVCAQNFILRFLLRGKKKKIPNGLHCLQILIPQTQCTNEAHTCCTNPLYSNVCSHTFEPLRGVYPCAPFGSSSAWREDILKWHAFIKVWANTQWNSEYKSTVEVWHLFHSDGKSSVWHKLDFHLLFSLLEREERRFRYRPEYSQFSHKRNSKWASTYYN